MTDGTADSLRLRAASALHVMNGRGVDLVVLTPSADLRYLSGYAGHASERPTLYALAPGRNPCIVLPRLEAPALAGRSELTVTAYSETDDPYVLLLEWLSAAPDPNVIALSDQAWSVVLLQLQMLLPSSRFCPASSVLGEVRAVKSADELTVLHEAGRKADRVFERLIQGRFAGCTERQIAHEIDRLVVDEGLARADWGPIVASGPHSSSPHHSAGDREIRTGDVVVLDFGGVLEGYQADITRTVHVGTPDARFAAVFDAVVRAQQAGFEAAVAGAAASRVDEAARRIIEDAGLGEYFIHRTGHGLGLDVHENPYLVAGNDSPLSVGMTFSVEPGVYLDDRFGVRVEDTVAIFADGPRRFNDATRDLVIVR